MQSEILIINHLNINNMDKNNIHLEIASALLNERQLASEISKAIYYALGSLNSHLHRIIQHEIKTAEYYDGDLHSIESYVQERVNKLMVLAGVYTYNPNGCEGEQTYKFIQEFTQIHTVDVNPVTDIMEDSDFSNYTQAEFNSLTEE